MKKSPEESSSPMAHRPVIISSMRTPKLYMSAMGEILPLLRYSGAIYALHHPHKKLCIQHLHEIIGTITHQKNYFGKQLISCNISTLDEAAVRNDQLD
jgi:hypothetical protein